MAKRKLHLHNIFFTYAWLLLTTGIILICIAGVYFSSLTKDSLQNKNNETDQVENSEQTNTFLEENSEVKGVQTVVETDDGRAELIAKFLERYQSPMQPYDYYGQKFVEIADRYQLDFRLLPAIAMQESNLCRHTHEDAPHNCLGFGIHERGTLDFESYEAGFERAGREIRSFYVNEGRITPEQIQKKYTPSSNGSWANSVNQWMAEMRYNDQELGRTLKEDANVLEFVVKESTQETEVK